MPVVVEPAAPVAAQPPKPKTRRRRGGEGLIELEIDGVAVRVGRGEARTVAAVIQALKGAW